MSYQVLARKWRPATFNQLVGQSHVVNALVNGLDSQRLHHAYLFAGTRGVGKTTIARIFAKSLNCETGTSSEPCGKCPTCVDIDQGRYVDLLEVDAASRTKVEDTREILDNVQYKPSRGQYKVYLIDEVHMLSKHSFNALLKTLEEPPPHVKFLLATTDPQKLPVTILSRCLQFNLKALSVEQIQGQLDHVLSAEHISFDSQATKLLARSAKGSMRDALSLTDQAIAQGNGQIERESVVQMLGLLEANVVAPLLGHILKGESQQTFQQIEKIAEKAPDYQRLLGELLSLLHQVALTQFVPQACKVDTTIAKFIYSVAKAVPPEQVQLQYQIALQGRKELAFANDPRSGFEMTVLRMLSFNPSRSFASADDIREQFSSSKQQFSATELDGETNSAALESSSDDNTLMASDVAPVSAAGETEPGSSATQITDASQQTNLQDLESQQAAVEAMAASVRGATDEPQDIRGQGEHLNLAHGPEQQGEQFSELGFEQTQANQQQDLDSLGSDPKGLVSPLQQQTPTESVNQIDALLAIHEKLQNPDNDNSIKKNDKVVADSLEDTSNSAADYQFTRDSISAETPPWLTNEQVTPVISLSRKASPELTPIADEPKLEFDASQPIQAEVTKTVPVFDQRGNKVTQASQIDNWSELIQQLSLTGLVKQLALCSQFSRNGHKVELKLLREKQDLCTDSAVTIIEQQLSGFFGEKIELNVVFEDVADVPVALQQEIKVNRQQHAESVIANDKNLHALENVFGTVLIENSIKPR